MTDLFKRKKRLQELKRNNFSDVRPEDIKIKLSFESQYFPNDIQKTQNYIQKIRYPLTKIFKEKITSKFINVAKNFNSVDLNIKILVLQCPGNTFDFYLNYHLTNSSGEVLGYIILFEKDAIIGKNKDEYNQYQKWPTYLKKLKNIQSEDIIIVLSPYIFTSEFENYKKSILVRHTKLKNAYDSIYSVFNLLKQLNLFNIPYSTEIFQPTVYIDFQIKQKITYHIEMSSIKNTSFQPESENYLDISEINYKSVISFLFGYDIFDKKIQSFIKDLDKDSYFECLKLLTY